MNLDRAYDVTTAFKQTTPDDDLKSLCERNLIELRGRMAEAVRTKEEPLPPSREVYTPTKADIRGRVEAVLLIVFTVSMILWMASTPSVETEQTLRYYSESETR